MYRLVKSEKNKIWGKQEESQNQNHKYKQKENKPSIFCLCFRSTLSFLSLVTF